MIAQFIILAMGIGSGSFMLSLAQIFAPLRLKVLERGRTSGFFKWLYQLLNCPFCVSVWMSLIANAIYRIRLVPYYWPLGYLVTALALSSGAMAAVLVIRKALGK